MRRERTKQARDVSEMWCREIAAISYRGDNYSDAGGGGLCDTGGVDDVASGLQITRGG